MRDERHDALIRGVVPIVPTPFSDEGALDLGSLRRAVDYLIDAGVQGLAVLGVASEIYALTDAERIDVVAATVDQVAGRVPVVAGASHGSGEAAASLARETEAAGADGLLVMPPSFVKPAERELVDYFGLVARAVDVPIMIQDNPAWTGVSIPVSTYDALAALDNVVYAKVEVPFPPAKIRELREVLGDRFTIHGGLAGNWLLEELAAGSVGTMPAAIMPEIYVQIWERWLAGDVRGMRALFNHCHPLIRLTGQPSLGLAFVKHILWRRGILSSSRVRNPLRQLTPMDVAALEAVLDDLGMTC